MKKWLTVVEWTLLWFFMFLLVYIPASFILYHVAVNQFNMNPDSGAVWLAMVPAIFLADVIADAVVMSPIDRIRHEQSQNVVTVDEEESDEG